MTDSQVIREVLEGDTNSFRILVDRYQNQVAATVIGMLGFCPEADDVGQEVFIRFYHALGRFRGDSSVATYITRIAINLSLNELKRRKRKFGMFTEHNEDIEHIPYESNTEVGTEFDSGQVSRAIESLDAKFKSVVVLRLVDGYSTSETAKILRLPVGTVLSRLARAQKKLRDLLLSLNGDHNE